MRESLYADTAGTSYPTEQGSNGKLCRSEGVPINGDPCLARHCSVAHQQVCNCSSCMSGTCLVTHIASTHRHPCTLRRFAKPCS